MATDGTEFNLVRENPELFHCRTDQKREKGQSLTTDSVPTPHIYKAIFLANDHPIILCEFSPQLAEDPHTTWTGKPPNFVPASPKQHNPL